MGKENPIQAKAYLRNIARLQAYIRENNYRDGGWLPAGRKMAELMGTSHLTYVRAIKFLENEGIVKPFANRGHYVIPEILRCQKIGMIIHGGEYVPFLWHHYTKSKEGYLSDVSAIVETLAENHFDTQLIQMPSAQQAFEIAQAYYMKGLIWFDPQLKDCDAIREYQQGKDRLPFVVTSTDKQVIDSGIDVVKQETTDQLYQRVAYLLKQGHTRFLFQGSFDKLKTSGALKLITQAGIKFTRHDCFEKSFLNMHELCDLITAKCYTGILANGHMDIMMYLFEALRTLPEKSKPEVHLHSKTFIQVIHTRVPQILAGYPKSKIMAPTAQSQRSLGVLAVQALLGQIRDQTD